jgi:hypothetical protein
MVARSGGNTMRLDIGALEFHAGLYILVWALWGPVAAGLTIVGLGLLSFTIGWLERRR